MPLGLSLNRYGASLLSVPPRFPRSAMWKCWSITSLRKGERALLETFFASAPILPLSQSVLEQAVVLRQQRKMTLGDALVAGTALTHGLTLATHNTSDFAWITELKLFDPLEQ